LRKLLDYICIVCDKKFKSSSLNVKTCSRDCLSRYRGRNRIKSECGFCGGEIFVPPSRFNKYDKHYCDIECRKKGLVGENSGTWEGGGIKVNCSCCNKEIFVGKNKFIKNERFFCDLACRDKFCIGENSHSYKGKVAINCDYCGKEKIIFPSQYEKYKRHFCDGVCRGKQISIERKGFLPNGTKSKIILLNCTFCGDFFCTRPHLLNDSGRKFCSIACESSWRKIYYQKDNNPNFRGGEVRFCEICGDEFWNIPSRDHKVCGNRACLSEYFIKHKIFAGENNSNWKGGITPFKIAVRSCGKYNAVRERCFERDGYKSVISNKSGFLHHHHIVSYNFLFREYGITENNIDEFGNILFDLENVITMLDQEHYKFHSVYGWDNNTQQLEQFKKDYLGGMYD